MLDVYKDIFIWLVHHGKMLVESKQDPLSLSEIVCRIFFRLINNFWNELAALIMRSLFMTEINFQLVNVNEQGLYWSFSVLLNSFRQNIILIYLLSAKHHYFPPVPKFVSQANSFWHISMKLFISLLMCFLNLKSPSSTLLCWKVTNGRNGYRSYLT